MCAVPFQCPLVFLGLHNPILKRKIAKQGMFSGILLKWITSTNGYRHSPVLESISLCFIVHLCSGRLLTQGRNSMIFAIVFQWICYLLVWDTCADLDRTAQQVNWPLQHLSLAKYNLHFYNSVRKPSVLTGFIRHFP